MSVPARALMIAGWVYLAGYAAWSVTLLGANLPRDAFNDLLFLPFYFGTAGAAFLAGGSPRNDSRLARGWRLIGAAWIVSGAGSLLWLLHRAMPSAALDWIAWTVYNGYYPLVIAGLWHFLERPTDGVTRFRLGVEALIAMTATAVLAWYFVFRHNQAVDGAPEVLKQIAVLFVGELLVVGAASAVLQRPAPTANVRSLVALGLGAFSAAIADLAYEQNQLLGVTWSGRVGDVLLAVGATLIFSAALAWRRRSVAEHPLPVVSRGLTLLPFVAVGVVASLLIWESVRANLGQGPVAGLTIGGAILLVLVIARLLVAQRELGREAAARAAQDARFRSLVERSSDAMLVVTPSGLIRWASPAFGRMVGLGDETVAGRGLTEFVPAELGGALEAWLTAPKSAVLSAWRLGHGGRWRDVEALGTDLTTDPAVAGIVVNVRDV